MKTTFILTLIIVFLCILLVIMNIGFSHKSKYGKINLTYNIHQEMYDLISHIHNLFVNNNIQYSLAAGSALGQVRNNGIIPWDDDMDIYILSKDKDLTEKIIKNDPKLKFKLKDFGYQIGFKNKGELRYLDIFVMYEKGEKLLYKGHSDAENEILYKDEWDLELVNFGPCKVYIIKKVNDYLNRSFGKDWKTIALISPKHGERPTPYELITDKSWTNLYTNYFSGKKLYL